MSGGRSLATVPTDELLAEVARRCGAGYKPRSSAPASDRKRGGFATKAEWARAKAQEHRDEYNAATDPSVKARAMADIGKFELLATRYERNGQ